MERIVSVSVMMAITHAAISASATSLILATANPLTLGLAILGSQLPDLDSTNSVIGQICFPLSSWIEDRFPHRSLTHSLLATAAIALLSIAVGHFFLGQTLALIALPIGHLAACFSDTFTKQGVQLFWPEPAWCISVSNPRRRLRTGGTAEYWVLAIAIALLCAGLYLATGGGITQAVGQNLGLRDTVMQTYNEAAATHQVYAQVQGVWASDRTPADGRYLILGTAGSEFIVSDGQGLYRTGEQIIVDRLTTEVGEAAATTVQTLNFSDEDAVAKVREVAVAYPDASIYLSGSITVDFPEEISIPIQPDRYATMSLSGETVTLEFHPLDQAVLQLQDQYAVGTLEVRIVR